MMQSRRFDPLLRRAQEHEDTVARDLAERQRAHELQESRLAELRRYADEYASSQMAAISPAQLANRRAFLDRLENAVEQQSRTVDNSRENVDAELARLLLDAQCHYGQGFGYAPALPAQEAEVYLNETLADGSAPIKARSA